MKGKVQMYMYTWVGSVTRLFMEIVRSMLDVFFPFSLVSLTELCSFWISLICPSLWTKLSLTIKTDDVTSGRRDVHSHERLRTAYRQMG